VPEMSVMHTALLDAAMRREVRDLLDGAFDGAFDDRDWDNALGGLHVLLRDGDTLVGHAALVQRRLLHRGRSLRTGYVEAVAVRPDRRRRGHGSALMAGVERAVVAAYDLGALSATDDAAALYTARGWWVWPGRTGAIGPDGAHLTPEEDGGVHVRPVRARLDPAEPLYCDWRDGDRW
jgi:aminoglycoside 2'-N-acetyltransferase I